MPGPRLPVRKIRDVLRLSAAGMSKRQIAVSLGVSATAARDCILRAWRAGLAWPLPEGPDGRDAGGSALSRKIKKPKWSRFSSVGHCRCRSCRGRSVAFFDAIEGAAQGGFLWIGRAFWLT
jgi:hypothetical protein